MAATYTSKTSTKISFSQAHKAIDRQIEFYKYLRSKEFHLRRKKKIEHGLKGIVTQVAKNTVQVFVYDAWPDPGDRTGNLYRSIKVNIGNGYGRLDAYIEIYSDPNVAKAKLLPGFSYAAFFIEPVKFNSFLRPRGMKTRNTYRPFYQVWQKFMETFMPHWIKQRTEEAIAASMPRSLRGKE